MKPREPSRQPHRKRNTGGSADNARTSTLGVLLRKMEEYDGYVIGATNDIESIDPALWRRFHLQVPIELPGDEERFAILKRYLAPFEMSDEDIDILVVATRGASPSLLRGLMEGMKRNLIVRPKIKLPIDEAIPVMAPIISSMAPPPDMEVPPLWQGDFGLQWLDKLTWPPTRKEPECPASPPT